MSSSSRGTPSPWDTVTADSSGASQVVELQEAVQAFHRNGIAVILDVVYNHVGEPNHLFRIDKLYYLENNPDGSLTNWSGCGNDLRCGSAMTRRLVIESLIHLVTHYGVDGFRFDLASALARELHEVDRLGAFFDILRQDPVLSEVKLIAEPWDLGEGGYQVGNFPLGWAEWNDRYRNGMRAY